jgi:hypothetical protein
MILRFVDIGATNGAGTAYPYEAHEFAHGFYWVSCAINFYFSVLCFVINCLSF